MGTISSKIGATNICSLMFFARPRLTKEGVSVGVEALTFLSKKYGENVQNPSLRTCHLYRPSVQIRTFGHLNEMDLARRMAETDIHLSFSLTNISTVIYEAMACGCACVEADAQPHAIASYITVLMFVNENERCMSVSAIRRAKSIWFKCPKCSYLNGRSI